MKMDQNHVQRMKELMARGKLSATEKAELAGIKEYEKSLKGEKPVTEPVKPEVITEKPKK